MTDKTPDDVPVVKKVAKKAPAKKAVKKAPPKLTPATGGLSWEQDPVPEVTPVATSVPAVEVAPVPEPVVTEPVTSARVSPTEVVPTTGTLTLAKLRNLDNWRAFLHQITPVVVAAFVTLEVTTEDFALLWVPLVFAIADPLLSYANAQDKGRKIAYGVLGTLQSGGLMVALLGDRSPWLPIVSALLVAISSQLSRFYTPTSTMTTPDSPRAVTHAASR